MATIRLYGIANCDTVKKARTWLQRRGSAVDFIDFKRAGVPADRLDAWIGAVGWARLLNRRGTTWRRLDPAIAAAVADAGAARRMMVEHPSVIRRPVVEWSDGAVTVGFDPVDWSCR